jgi:hypothetical protein
MSIGRRKVLIAGLAVCLAAWLVAFSTERWLREPENYSLIEPGLYMGGWVYEPPPGTKSVLNLDDIRDGYRCETELHEPIRDGGKAPSIEWLRRMVEFVDSERKAGSTVYVHWFAGVSRSGMVIVAYEMYKNHWTRDEALEFVRTQRPQTRPNPVFMELLLEWEQVVHRGDERKTTQLPE